MDVFSLSRFALGCLLAVLLISPTRAETLERPDGTFITYHVMGRSNDARQGVVLMLQGSGCQPVIDRDWLKSEPNIIAPGRAVLVIEKFGVGASQAEQQKLDEGCPAAYWQGNTLQQRVMDAVRVIAHLRRSGWWSGELLVDGGSEGGAVAAMLAPLVPETRAVIVTSSGIGVSVAELIRSAVPPPVAEQIPQMLSAAVANPSSINRFGGESYRWWADAANVVPARSLLQTDVPILLIHGTRNQFAPVATARATRDMFQQSGKGNLTYWEFDGYDRFLVDNAGVSHNAEVLNAIATWIDAL